MVEIKASKITRIVLIFEDTSDDVAFALDVDSFANAFGGAKKLKGKIVTEYDGFEAGITLERASFDFKAEGFEGRFVEANDIAIGDKIITRKITGDRSKR